VIKSWNKIRLLFRKKYFCLLISIDGKIDSIFLPEIKGTINIPCLDNSHKPRVAYIDEKDILPSPYSIIKYYPCEKIDKVYIYKQIQDNKWRDTLESDMDKIMEKVKKEWGEKYEI